MTTFTERGSLDAVTFEGRELSTQVWTERGALDVLYCQTSGSTETTDTAGPVISNVHANKVGFTEVEIDWDTDEEANCRVDYGTGTNILAWTVGSVHQHYVTNNRAYVIDDLSQGTTYYFMVRSADRYGSSRVSGRYEFKTGKQGEDFGEAPQIST